jgi:hypothetical protein
VGYAFWNEQEASMLRIKRQGHVRKVKDAIDGVVAYLDEVAGDERLRADVRAAIGHGWDAGDQIRKDLRAGTTATRLASDHELRENIRRMLDDMERASDRMLRRKRHRIRNALLVLGGAAAAAAAVPRMRAWVTDRTPAESRVTGDVGLAV